MLHATVSKALAIFAVVENKYASLSSRNNSKCISASSLTVDMP